MQNDEHTKLDIYSKIKTTYIYEPYLNIHPHNKILTRYRLSNHYLPIERGRYTKPKTPRSERICPFCQSGLGNEIHVMFQCESPIIRNINDKYMNVIMRTSRQIDTLSDEGKLLLYS